MNVQLRFEDCRMLRPIVAASRQLELFSRERPRPMLESCCSRCGRAAYMAILVDGNVESRCDWHILDRLPLAVRRFALGRLSRKARM